jgi:hypothetical protein
MLFAANVNFEHKILFNGCNVKENDNNKKICSGPYNELCIHLYPMKSHKVNTRFSCN